MVSVLVLIATKIFFQSIKWIKVQKIFQGTFELFSILGQVLYLSRQTIVHLDPRIVCSLLVCWQVGYWLMQVPFSPSICIIYFRVCQKTIVSFFVKCLMSSITEEVSGSMFSPGLTKPLDLQLPFWLCFTLPAEPRAWLSPMIIILCSLSCWKLLLGLWHRFFVLAPTDVKPLTKTGSRVLNSLYGLADFCDYYLWHYYASYLYVLKLK